MRPLPLLVVLLAACSGGKPADSKPSDGKPGPVAKGKPADAPPKPEVQALVVDPQASGPKVFLPDHAIRGVVSKDEKGALSMQVCGARGPAQLTDGTNLVLGLLAEIGAGNPVYVEGGTRTRPEGQIKLDMLFRVQAVGGAPPCDLPGDHDWIALGNEPFWSLKSAGGSVMLTRPSTTSLTFPIRLPPDANDVKFGEAAREKPGLRLDGAFMSGPCRDGMSGAWFSHSARITLTESAPAGAKEGTPPTVVEMHGCAAPGLAGSSGAPMLTPPPGAAPMTPPPKAAPTPAPPPKSAPPAPMPK